MLKVIGASMQKTRIGTYILISAGLLVIGGFFIGYIERPQYDGAYCATAFWSKQVGFQIEYWKQQNDLLNIPQGAARICYKDSVFDYSWAQIEIETQRTYPDSVQAYGAGILEGSLTWNSIYNQWQNVIKTSCERNENTRFYCQWFRDLITENYVELKAYASLNAEHDHFWHQISLFFNQLEGLETGYIRGATRARSDLEDEIPFSDFLLMNSVPEILELNTYFYNHVAVVNRTEDKTSNYSDEINFPKTTMLMKIFQEQDSWQLLFGHCTLDNRASLKRIQKRYTFHYHFTPSQRANIVPGVDITFSGYPGILASTDDFYIIKGHLMQTIVAGVQLKNENPKIWENVNTKKLVPLIARVMAANRIAQNRRMWARTLTQHPYITLKQWITVDLHKLSIINNLHSKEISLGPSGRILEEPDKYKDIVWIVEQLPGGYNKRIDVTDMFLQKNSSSWITNGTPYFKEMLNVSGLISKNFSFNLASNDDAGVSNLKSVGNYLRFYGIPNDSRTIDKYSHFDIKLFSYNAKVGMRESNNFAGPVFVHFEHILPIDKAYSDDDNTISPAAVKNNKIYIDEVSEITELHGKRRSMRYASDNHNHLLNPHDTTNVGIN